jgi:hypothetical protein
MIALWTIRQKMMYIINTAQSMLRPASASASLSSTQARISLWSPNIIQLHFSLMFCTEYSNNQLPHQQQSEIQGEHTSRNVIRLHPSCVINIVLVRPETGACLECRCLLFAGIYIRILKPYIIHRHSQRRYRSRTRWIRMRWMKNIDRPFCCRCSTLSSGTRFEEYRIAEV